MSDNADDLPPVNVKSNISNFNRTERNARKLKSSQFLLTINTNQSYLNDPNIEGDTQYFDETLQRMFNNPLSYLTIKNEGETWTKQYVQDSDVQYAIELGGKYKKLHAHCIIKIKHYTSIQIDAAKIRRYIEQEMGLPSIHVNFKLLRGNREEINIENYLAKYVDE